jgi:dTDP-4-dehydrorhamnose 3,5-epimerase
MIFDKTRLKGAYIIKLGQHEDERGYFARGWCRKEAMANGLISDMVQANISFNNKKGTLRGMHYQVAPFQEVKIVRCVRGAIFDVIIDMRPNSKTFKQWLAVELTQDNGLMLYVPEDFAHGFQTLTDAAEVNYLVSNYYNPEAERGVRFDDPAIGIAWPPVAGRIISNKDRSWPLFSATSAVANSAEGENDYR